jgi:hypothetical protein
MKHHNLSHAEQITILRKTLAQKNVWNEAARNEMKIKLVRLFGISGIPDDAVIADAQMAAFEAAYDAFKMNPP